MSYKVKNLESDCTWPSIMAAAHTSGFELGQFSLLTFVTFEALIRMVMMYCTDEESMLVRWLGQ